MRSLHQVALETIRREPHARVSGRELWIEREVLFEVEPSSDLNGWANAADKAVTLDKKRREAVRWQERIERMETELERPDLSDEQRITLLTEQGDDRSWLAEVEAEIAALLNPIRLTPRIEGTDGNRAWWLHEGVVYSAANANLSPNQVGLLITGLGQRTTLETADPSGPQR